MKYLKAESLSLALKDNNLQLKHLDVDDYLKTLKLIGQLDSYLQEISSSVQKLILEYNKDFVKKAKDLKDKKELTEEEKSFISSKPPVTMEEGMLYGPVDFIDKVAAIRDKDSKIKKDDLNFIKDSKTFKAMVENASLSTQKLLYENLFKA